jgi:hypothetical protein
MRGQFGVILYQPSGGKRSSNMSNQSPGGDTE